MTDSPEDDRPEPAPRKPLNSSWIFPVGGGVIGAYFLINGALGVRESQGDVVFALLMAGIVVILGVLGTLMFRSYRSERRK